MRKRVLLIREPADDEFATEANWLASQAELTCLTAAVLPAAGEYSAYFSRSLDEVPAPDIIALAQSRPGQWPAELVEGLHRRWPLARLVALLGSWCEGEVRSGRPLAGVQRLYWHDVELRMAGLLSDPESSCCPSWHLPRLATEMERLECDLHDRFSTLDGFVLIAAQSWSGYEPLAEACRQGGVAVAWQRPRTRICGAGWTAGIWDVEDGRADEWREMEDFAGSLAGASTLLVMGFPRRDDRVRAASFGARVLAKPFLLPDLWRELALSSVRAATIVGRCRAATRSARSVQGSVSGDGSP